MPMKTKHEPAVLPQLPVGLIDLFDNEPILIPKHEWRFTGFDEKIISLYARGMTVREIREFLLEQYGTHVSPEFVSSVTDEVMAEVTAWQSKPLEPIDRRDRWPQRDA